jgi:hypothetical protein
MNSRIVRIADSARSRNTPCRIGKALEVQEVPSTSKKNVQSRTFIRVERERSDLQGFPRLEVDGYWRVFYLTAAGPRQ